MKIRREELSPEEHEAVFGDRADNRVKVWRETFGPGDLRFRNEVFVCTGCARVTITKLVPGEQCHGTTGRMVRKMDAMSPEVFKRWGHKLSDKQLKHLVPEPCDGVKVHPTTEVGYRWLDGEEF
jgi:hypothetical protein